MAMSWCSSKYARPEGLKYGAEASSDNPVKALPMAMDRAPAPIFRTSDAWPNVAEACKTGDKPATKKMDKKTRPVLMLFHHQNLRFHCLPRCADFHREDIPTTCNGDAVAVCAVPQDRIGSHPGEAPVLTGIRAGVPHLLAKQVINVDIDAGKDWQIVGDGHVAGVSFGIEGTRETGQFSIGVKGHQGSQIGTAGGEKLAHRVRASHVVAD